MNLFHRKPSFSSIINQVRRELDAYGYIVLSATCTLERDFVCEIVCSDQTWQVGMILDKDHYQADYIIKEILRQIR